MKGAGTLRDLGGGRWQVIDTVDGHKVTRVFTAANGTEAERLAQSVRMAAAVDGARCYGGRLSGATITKVHNVLAAILPFAVDVQKDLRTNPAHDKNAKPNLSDGDEWREDGEKCAALDVAAVSRFVELARVEESPEAFMAILLSARLGLRRGEALAVQWRDIDYTTRRATIRRAVSQAPAREKVAGQKRETTGVAWRGGKTAGHDYTTAQPDGSGLTPPDYTSRFRALAKRHQIAVTRTSSGIRGARR